MILDPILTQTAWAECILPSRTESFMGKDMLIAWIIAREFPERNKQEYHPWRNNLKCETIREKITQENFEEIFKKWEEN